MSDLERKLRDLAFRTPPAPWRRDILANAASAKNAAWNWREWLWPSPIAWGAMAALWIILLWINAASAPDSPPMPSQIANDHPPESLYAFHSQRNLPALLEALN